MTGETSLARLLSGMRPILDPQPYVFATGAEQAVRLDRAVLGAMREDEGVTIIAEPDWARAQGLTTSFPCRRITLTVHSSLEAVGLMAAVTAVLAEAGISTNPVSGFYHDHLFVPERDAERALRLLEAVSADGRSSRL